MIRRVLLSLVLVAIAAVLLVALWPEPFGLQAAPVIAQVVSLRGLDVVIALAVLVVVGLAALAWRRGRRFLGLVVALLFVFSLANVAILGARGFAGAAGTTTSKSAITVLSWNTKGGAPGPDEIAKLALADHADVIALPETTQQTGVAVAGLMKSAGRPMWVLSAAHGYIYASHATTLLISSALGHYEVDPRVGDTSVLSSVVAKPDDTAEPTIIAVHAVSPKPEEMRNWRSDLHYLSTLCTGRNLIMAGDFNSTIDDLRPLSTQTGADFGQCRDSGLASSGGAVGTWPTNLPELFGAQIDHVMYGTAWKVVSMKVIGTEDAAGSDHRPILVTLAPAS
jgi:endonuclease/exonuclease/phosphatase (EEP) superfamily protein YafD